MIDVNHLIKVFCPYTLYVQGPEPRCLLHHSSSLPSPAENSTLTLVQRKTSLEGGFDSNAR